MKKAIAIATLALLTLGSCKKDNTCSCTSAANPEFSKNYAYGKTKKSDADETCKAQQTQLKMFAPDATCKLN